MKRTAGTLGALGLVLGLAMSMGGCLVTASGHGRLSGGGSVVAYSEPPPPQQERYDMRAGQVWIKGRWDWQGGQWVWMPGHYENDRNGYMYSDGRWEQHDGSWHWVDGTWVVDDRARVRDHTGGNGYNGNPGYQGGYNGGYQGGSATNPDGSGASVVVGGGQVSVNVNGPTVAPPPVRVENPGPARGGFVWINGYYQWQAGQYAWIPGHWERQKANQVWFDGHWDMSGGVWVWTQGEWRVQQQGQMGNTIDRRSH